MKALTIEGSSGRPIAIDFYPSGQAGTSLIIFVHGFKGFKNWGTHHLTAHFFNQENFSFLAFNFSHNGISSASKDVFDDLGSFAENTFSKELLDLDEVITFSLSGEAFPAPEKLFLIGHSRGGGISIIQTFQDHRITKLATWASLSRFNNLWNPTQEEEWKKTGIIYTLNGRTKQNMPLNLTLLEDLEQHSEELDINNAAKNIARPWLIVHGDQDRAVPVEQGYELHRQNPRSDLFIVENGDHVFGAKHPWEQDELPAPLKLACSRTAEFFLQP